MPLPACHDGASSPSASVGTRSGRVSAARRRRARRGRRERHAGDARDDRGGSGWEDTSADGTEGGRTSHGVAGRETRIAEQGVKQAGPGPFFVSVDYSSRLAVDQCPVGGPSGRRTGRPTRAGRRARVPRSGQAAGRRAWTDGSRLVGNALEDRRDLGAGAGNREATTLARRFDMVARMHPDRPFVIADDATW